MYITRLDERVINTVVTVDFTSLNSYRPDAHGSVLYDNVCNKLCV